MIDYTNIILEAYQDNHIEFLGIWHNKKHKLSLKTDLIDVLYLEWFISKMQIIERDYFIENDNFIKKCFDTSILVGNFWKNDKSNQETFIEYSFIMLTLLQMHKAILDEQNTNENKFLTNLDNKQREQKCSELIEQSKNKDIKHYNKVFTEAIDKPTLLYLLGGERPENIKKIRMASSHKNVESLLLSISEHKFDNKICIPNFVKYILCPEILLDKKGEPIKKLNQK